MAIGARIAHLFVTCITPLNPLTSRVPMAVRAPGNVSAITVGSIVCIVKKTGNVAVCRVANCGLGRDLKAITPPMKDFVVVSIVICGSRSIMVTHLKDCGPKECSI